MYYEITIGTVEKRSPVNAIDKAIAELRLIAPDAKIFGVRTYGGDGQQYGVDFLVNFPGDTLEIDFEEFESIEAVADNEVE